jgi:hypothetical protein
MARTPKHKFVHLLRQDWRRESHGSPITWEISHESLRHNGSPFSGTVVGAQWWVTLYIQLLTTINQLTKLLPDNSLFVYLVASHCWSGYIVHSTTHCYTVLESESLPILGSSVMVRSLVFLFFGLPLVGKDIVFRFIIE